MKYNTIYAMILRNLYTFRRNYDRLFDAFYWPIMEMVVWGITSMYIVRLSPDFANILMIIVAGLAFWVVVSRSQYEINIALLEDIWARNLINIFVSPITFWEWLASVVTIGFFKALISFVVSIALALLLYQIHFTFFGLYLIPFIFLLLMTGWWVSFLITGIIMRYGSRVQTFAWTLVYILAPLSAIYYPVSLLPDFVQKVSFILPTTYVFQGIRSLITTGALDNNALIVSLLLNSIYLIFSLYFLRNSFNSLLKKGMQQLH